jgi:hypothetical protein
VGKFTLIATAGMKRGKAIMWLTKADTPQQLAQ